MRSPLSKYTDGKVGGYLVGRPHSKKGIKAIVKDTGELIELEGKEVVINKKSVQDPRKLHTFNGQRLTNREILSKINSQDGNGVAFEKGGSIRGKATCGCTHKFATGGIMELSLLNKDYDLLGSGKQPWMMTFEQFKKTLKDLYEQKTKARYTFELATIQKRLNYLLPAWQHRTVKGDIVNLAYKTHISKAIKSNDFKNAVEQGRLTWADTKEIIASAGLIVPPDILSSAGGYFASGGELKSWYEIGEMKYSDAEPEIKKYGFDTVVTPGDIAYLIDELPTQKGNSSEYLEQLAEWMKNPDNFYYVDRIIPRGNEDYVVIRNEHTDKSYYVDLQDIDILLPGEQKIWYNDSSFLASIFGLGNRFETGGPVAEEKEPEVWMYTDAAEWAQSLVHPRNVKRNAAMKELVSLSKEFNFYDLSNGQTVEHWVNDKVLQHSTWDKSRKLSSTGIQEIDGLIKSGAAKTLPAKRFLKKAKEYIQNEKKSWDVDPYEFGYRYYEEQVKKAFESGKYDKAIKERELTPGEVRKILVNAGLPVPDAIAAAAEDTLKDGGDINDERPLRLSDIPQEVKTFLPEMQQRALVGSREMRGEIEKLKQIIHQMPKTYETRNIPVNDRIVWLHYFYGNMDYYITEKDMEPEQIQATGYSTDGHDGEWGYISIEELKATNKVELDLYFEPVKFGILMGVGDKQHDDTIYDVTHMEPVIITDSDIAKEEAEIERDPFNNPLQKFNSKSEFLKAVDEHVEYLYPNKATGFPRGLNQYEKVIEEKTGKYFMATTPSKNNILLYAGYIWDDLSKSKSAADKSILKSDDPFENTLEKYTSKEQFIDAVTSKVMGEAARIRDKGLSQLTQPDVKAVLTKARHHWDELIKQPGIPKELSSQASTITKGQQAEINNQVRAILSKNGIDVSNYSAEEIALLKLYAGAGGLSKHGESGARLLDQFYTPMDIAAKMWGLAIKYGFKFPGSNILEPSVGTGNFLQFIPSDVSVNVVAYDVDEVSYKISKVLFPQFDIRHNSFESMFFAGRRHIGLAGVNQFFDLVIGNPPYRDYVSEYAPLGERDATGAFTFEMYFIMRGVDVLKSGGLLVMIIPNSFLSNDNKYNSFKEELARKADLIDAYRLPNGVFKFTDIGTDIIILRKK